VPGPSGPQEAAEPAQVSTCDLIEDAAATSGLPVDYFTRLIWRESSFRPWVVSPVGAQGIAQFMPGTAAERGLLDPFDPLQAIPASAQLLVSLAQRFGNLGLAAAAYNAGPRRVEEWLAGTGGMPRETRNYVANVTGLTVEEWRDATDEMEWDAPETPPTCTDVLAALDAPPLSDAALQAPDSAVEWQPWGVQVAGNFSQSPGAGVLPQPAEAPSGRARRPRAADRAQAEPQPGDAPDDQCPDSGPDARGGQRPLPPAPRRRRGLHRAEELTGERGLAATVVLTRCFRLAS
jgi:hypothetical protein